jgi:hypothetical protein
MKYLTIRLVKADIKQHVVKSKNYSENQGERPTFSNSSFLEIKGSIPDLIPHHDFLELRENGEPHYIDKIKIIINLSSSQEASDEIPRAHFNRNYFGDSDDIYFDEKELCIGGITWNEQRFNQVNQLLRDEFTSIDIAFFRKFTDEEFKKKHEEDGSKIVGVDEFETVEITREQRIINGEEKRVLCISKYSLISFFDLYSSRPKFLDKSEWLEDVESIKDLQAEQELDRKYAEAEAKNRLPDILPASTNKPDVELKGIYRLLIVIAIFLLVIIFKL